MGGVAAQNQFMNDLWHLQVSGSQCRWTEVQCEGDAPDARWGHAMVMLDQKLVMFGGSALGTCFNDVWVFDTQDEPVWQCVSMHPSCSSEPEGRAGHSCTVVD